MIATESMHRVTMKLQCIKSMKSLVTTDGKSLDGWEWCILSVSYIARVHLKVSQLIPQETNPRARIKTHATRGTRDVIWIQDQA